MTFLRSVYTFFNNKINPATQPLPPLPPGGDLFDGVNSSPGTQVGLPSTMSHKGAGQVSKVANSVTNAFGADQYGGGPVAGTVNKAYKDPDRLQLDSPQNPFWDDGEGHAIPFDSLLSAEAKVAMTPDPDEALTQALMPSQFQPFQVPPVPYNPYPKYDLSGILKAAQTVQASQASLPAPDADQGPSVPGTPYLSMGTLPAATLASFITPMAISPRAAQARYNLSEVPGLPQRDRSIDLLRALSARGYR